MEFVETAVIVKIGEGCWEEKWKPQGGGLGPPGRVRVRVEGEEAGAGLRMTWVRMGVGGTGDVVGGFMVGCSVRLAERARPGMPG